MKWMLAWISSSVVLMSTCACTRAEDSTPGANTPAVTTPCADALDQRTLTACWAEASGAAKEDVDAALKEVTELLASRTTPSSQRLQDDQRRWREFVEAHCDLYGDLYEGGSAAPMSVSMCRWQLAQARIQQLAQLSEELNR